MPEFKLTMLDHVALRVRDLEAAAKWYEEVLGMKRLQPKEWGAFPIFMLAENGSGIALFPTRTEQPKKLPTGDWIRGDHYAFRVDPGAFEAAQEHLRQLDITFEWQDHYYYHSIYFQDPDGHQLEITTEVRPL